MYSVYGAIIQSFSCEIIQPADKHCVQKSVLCTVYITVYCVQNRVLCTVYNAQHSVLCTEHYCVQCTVYRVQCTMYRAGFKPFPDD